jgi:hypothetical protein
MISLTRSGAVVVRAMPEKIVCQDVVFLTFGHHRKGLGFGPDIKTSVTMPASDCRNRYNLSDPLNLETKDF